MLGRTSTAAIAAALAFASGALAEEAATPEIERLGTAIGDMDFARKSCPELIANGEAIGQEIQRLGGERLDTDPIFQRAIRQRMMNGQGDLRREGPKIFCDGLLKKYGDEGSVLKGVIARAK